MQFSIIIPLYNCQDSIGRVISCIKNQDFPKNQFEVICVDDKSTDHTVKIIKKFKDIKLVQLPENHGNGNAKNVGIKTAKGKILFFIDDHIYLQKNTLKIIGQIFKDNPNVDGVCGNYKSLRKSDRNIYRDIRRRTIYLKNNGLKIITNHNFSTFSINVGAIKKKLFIENMFPDNFGKNSGEDIALEIQLLNKHKTLLYSPLIRAYHDHNLSRSKIFKKAIIEIKGTGDLIHFLLKKKQTIPFLYGFLSYPLFLLISLFLIMFNKIFIWPFFFTLIIEVVLASKSFFDKESSMLNKLNTFIYILAEELIKGMFLPYYLLKKGRNNIAGIFATLNLLIKWEIEKVNSLINIHVQN